LNACRLLDWDTEFFGRRIASFASVPKDRESFDRAIAWCVAEKIDCVYLLSELADLATRRAAEDHGFRLMDVRTTFELDMSRLRQKPGAASVASIRLACPEDLPHVRALAAKAHGGTRFWADERFPRDRCAELYSLWIEKSLGGEAQAVWVGGSEDRIDGYFTCVLKDDGSGQLGLGAVAPEARGAGLGRALVERALAWFGEQGCARVGVVTQGSSLAAQRLYESAGFRIVSMQVWHHRWFDRAS